MLQEAPRATAGNGGVTGVKDPSGCPGVMRPAPVMNTDMTEPRGAGFDGELTEPSWFRTAACPLPVAFDVKRAGTASNTSMRPCPNVWVADWSRSEEHTSEL